MRTCIFTGFHSLFLGFCHISGSSARFPLFFGCFSDFCGVFYDFLPLCSFQAKNRLSSAFIGFPRLFARFCLFCSVFPYIRAFNSVLTDFLRFRNVLRLFPAFTDLFRIFRAFLKDLSCFAVSLPYSAGFRAYLRSFT